VIDSLTPFQKPAQSLRWLRVGLLFLIGASLLAPVRALSANPFKYDPIIDDPPIIPQRSQTVEWVQTDSGVRVGAFLGAYFGSASSFLTKELSSLDTGTHPQFGLTLGYRFSGETSASTRGERWLAGGIARRFELSLQCSAGFGRTYERRDYDDAVDVLLRPQLTFHLLDGQLIGLGVIAGLQAAIFDIERGEVSQAALGPMFGGRLTWKVSRNNHVFIEGGWSHLYDFLAYSFRPPTEDELIENPQITRFKVTGDWFNLYQVTVGYQLLGF
jgi:hypothetical protein